jgi:RNA polymerase sigma-70 factor, ECF subfamily
LGSSHSEAALLISSPPPPPAFPDDEQLIALVLQGRIELFELLMRRNNQRVYRVVRAILRDDTEVEDVMQEAYVNAFAHLADFSGRARFSTWITRIAMHESFARLRRRGRTESLSDFQTEVASMESSVPSPEAHASDGEMRQLLEQAVDALPGAFRTVFVLRAIEEMSVAETASVLQITEETVKTRLHRARALIRERLTEHMEQSVPAAFGFHLDRCDRVVAGVLARVRRTHEGDRR